MKENNEYKIESKVMEAIRSGQVKMKPKWRFVLQTSIFVVGTITLTLLVIYMASFIEFVLRQTGLMYVSGFGSQGYLVFLRSLPWLLIAFTFIFIVLLEVLVRYYRFAYRRPLVVSAVAVLGVVFVGSAVVAQTKLHKRVFVYSDQGGPIFVRQLYKGYTPPPRGLYRGVVTESYPPQVYVIRDISGETSTVIISPVTRLPYGADFQIGDTMVVFGERQMGIIKAMGCREVKDSF